MTLEEFLVREEPAAILPPRPMDDASNSSSSHTKTIGNVLFSDLPLVNDAAGLSLGLSPIDRSNRDAVVSNQIANGAAANLAMTVWLI